MVRPVLQQQRRRQGQCDGRIRSTLREIFRDFCGFSSLHGVSWYIREKNRHSPAALFVVAVAMATIVVLPVTIVYSSVSFLRQHEVKNSIEWVEESNLTYPNVTVCHSAFFDKSKMEKFNVSEDLATYLSSSVDPSYSYFAEEVVERDTIISGIFYEGVNRMEKELDVIMEENQMDALALFRALAISCDDFLFFCEVHHRHYMPKSVGALENCCGTIFSPEPTFSVAGTCFTTYADIVEVSPSVFGSLKVWANFMREKTPDFSVLYKGSDPAERTGGFWALSRDDHPSAVLTTAPKKLAVGKTVVASLRVEEVRREDLTGVPCARSNVTFRETYGMENTKLNCELARSDTFYRNCTLAPFYGLNTAREDASVCYPKLMTETTFESTTYRLGWQGNMNNFRFACAESCAERSFSADAVTEADVNANAVERFYGQLREAGVGWTPNAEDMSILQVHFASFKYPKFILTQETFAEFLSRIGGWMGFAVGASIFSLFEIVSFTGQVLLLFVGSALGRMRGRKEVALRSKEQQE